MTEEIIIVMIMIIISIIMNEDLGGTKKLTSLSQTGRFTNFSTRSVRHGLDQEEQRSPGCIYILCRLPETFEMVNKHSLFTARQITLLFRHTLRDPGANYIFSCFSEFLLPFSLRMG